MSAEYRRHFLGWIWVLFWMGGMALGQAPGPGEGGASAVGVAEKEDLVAVAALEVLRDQCVSCHRPGKSKGRLKLTSLEEIQAGGESGPVLVAGDSKKSLLSQVLAKDGDPHMPPKKQLSPAQMEAVRVWIDGGAKWSAGVMERPPKVEPVALHAMPERVQPVLSMALDREGNRLAVVHGGTLEIRDVKADGFPVVRSWKAHVDSVQAVGWSPDGAFVLSGGFRALRIWNASDGTLAGEMKDWVGDVGAFCFSKDGAVLWVGDSLPTRGGYLAVVDWGSRKVARVWRAHDDSILGLTLATDGKSMVSASADRLVRRWDMSSRLLMATYEGHTNQVLGVAFDPLNARIASTGADREIKVWDVATREQDAVLGDKKQVYSALVWSADGKALVGVTDRGQGTIFTEIRKHDGAQRSDVAKVQSLTKLDAFLQSVVVSADASWVAVGASDGRLFLWKSKDAKWVPLLENVSASTAPPATSPVPASTLTPSSKNP